jgi:hypothetical protein
MRNTGAFLVLALFSLAGCATLPVSGPVTVGGQVSVADQTEVEYLPAGPAKGATQREILDGFIAASAAPQNNFRIARSFLTDDQAQSWNPARETLIRGIYTRVTTTSSTAMSLVTTLNGRVNESGVYTPLHSSEPVTIDVQFQQVGGEWRISAVPDLSLVTNVAFESAYNEYTTYFFNASRTALIPDVRVFARQGDPVTAVTRAVIAGPSEYLPNAISVFPKGASLATAPVDTTSGRAIVNVSEEVTRASSDDQRAMLAELNASLDQFTSVSGTSLTVNNVPIAVSALPVANINPRVDDLPLVVRGGKFGTLVNDTVTATRANGARIANLKPTSVAYDVSSGIAAVSTRVGVYRVSDHTERVSDRRSLVEAQIDDAGSVWWADRQTPNRISVFAGGSVKTFGGPWSNTATIGAVEVSRENARLAIAVNVGGSSRLYVAAISVDENARPTALGGFRLLPSTATTISDLTWVDSTTLALIGETDRVPHVEVVSVGGRTTLLGQPQSPVHIVGGNTGIAGLLVLSESGQLWKPRGGGWQSTGWSADVLTTQH